MYSIDETLNPRETGAGAMAGEIARALASLQRVPLDPANGRSVFAEARLCEAVRRAGTVALDRTRSHPAGACLDLAFGVLSGEHGAPPWPMTHRAHQRDLLRAMVHLARARLALIRGQILGARDRLAAARSVLERIGRDETMLVWLRITRAILALDEAERRLADIAPRAA